MLFEDGQKMSKVYPKNYYPLRNLSTFRTPERLDMPPPLFTIDTIDENYKIIKLLQF